MIASNVIILGSNLLLNIITSNYITSNVYSNFEDFIHSLTTDDLKQGTSNHYYNDNQASSNFYNNLTNINLDQIHQGTSNKFIVNNTYNNNLTINGLLTASQAYQNHSAILLFHRVVPKRILTAFATTRPA